MGPLLLEKQATCHTNDPLGAPRPRVLDLLSFYHLERMEMEILFPFLFNITSSFSNARVTAIPN